MTSYVIGIDPGQANDPTALALIEYDTLQEPTYHLRGLHRFPLKTPYTTLPAALEQRLSSPPLLEHTLVAVDATGVGAPIIDLLRERLTAVPVYAITITGGTNTTGGFKDPHLPKRDLIGTLSVIVEQRRLRIAANMTNTAALIDELLAYRRTTNEHGHDTYAAAAGSHDDLVLATSLALWTAKNRQAAKPRPHYPSGVPRARLPTTYEIVVAAHARNWNYPYHS